VFSHGYLSSNPTQTEKKPAKAKAPAAHKAAATIANQVHRQHIAAGAVALLAGSFTFLSVHHLATGYAAVTHRAEWEAVVSAPAALTLGSCCWNSQCDAISTPSAIRFSVVWPGMASRTTLP
jgi:hypothetical protein